MANQDSANKTKGGQEVDVRAVLQAAFASGKLISLTDRAVPLGGIQHNPPQASGWPRPGQICQPSLF